MLGVNRFHGFQRDSGRRRKDRGISLLATNGSKDGAVTGLSSSPWWLWRCSMNPLLLGLLKVFIQRPAPNFHAVIQGIAQDGAGVQ